MPANKDTTPRLPPGTSKPSEEFSAYCEAEFERRLNSGETFDEAAYRAAQQLVLERLVALEQEGRRR
jgi:hypothetical protein